MDGSSPGLGHNSRDFVVDIKSFLAKEVVSEQLVVDYAEISADFADKMAGVARLRVLLGEAGITDTEMASRVTDFTAQLKRVASLVEGHRLIERDPYKGALDAVDAFFKAAMETPLRDAAKQFEGHLTAWQNRESARLRQEAQERADRMAAEAERLSQIADATGHTEMREAADTAQANATAAAITAQAPEADLRRQRGTLGGVAQGRRQLKVRVIDADSIPRRMLDFIESRAIAEARALLAASPLKEPDPSVVVKIPGLEFFYDNKAVVK